MPRRCAPRNDVRGRGRALRVLFQICTRSVGRGLAPAARQASILDPCEIKQTPCRGRRPRRPAAPSGAESRLTGWSVVPLARLMPLAEACCLVMPSATYFSWQRKVGKSCLSACSKPVPRHVSHLRLRVVPVLRPKITGENYSTRRPMAGGEGTSFYFGFFGACASISVVSLRDQFSNWSWQSVLLVGATLSSSAENADLCKTGGRAGPLLHKVCDYF